MCSEVFFFPTNAQKCNKDLANESINKNSITSNINMSILWNRFEGGNDPIDNIITLDVGGNLFKF